MNSLVSIHDLMPETMGRVERILDYLAEKKVPPVTLLVVPGKEWSPDQITRLQQLAAKGHTFAAHGWHHHTRPRKLYHRIHSVLISRDVAEHLDLDSAAILELLERSRAWFPQHDLPTPDFYVPPAWALGPITKADLARTTFTQIETTRGILYPQSDQQHRFEKLPLTGFEADTTLRATFLKVWNQLQTKKALSTDTPLRISIHPDDLELKLADQLDELLSQPWHYLHYDEW